MSWLCDTTELVPAGWLSSRYAGHGVLAEDIPSTGLDGPSPLYGAVTLPADNGKEIRGYLTRWPAAPLDIEEDGTFSYSGAPDYFEFALYADGAANTSDIGFGPGISRIWLGTEPGGAFSGSITLDGVTLSASFTGATAAGQFDGAVSLDGVAVAGSFTGAAASSPIARPISDGAPGGWTPSTGTALWPMLDELTPDDGDYIETNVATTGTVGLSAPTFPGGPTQPLRVRAASDDGSTLTVTLKQGATVIATRTQVLTATYTTYEWPLDAGEIALITAGAFTLDLQVS
jgi:hypothetical protein